jgi:hypothetical protein
MMADQPRQSPWDRIRSWCARCWQYVLDLALILWVVRVPLSFAALGLLILGETPQAQDLFVDLVYPATRESPEFLLRIPEFLFLLVFIWAMPTHYAARLLLDTDRRFRAYVERRRAAADSRCLASMELWVPRLLGLVPFVAVIIALVRSHLNLPILDQQLFIAAEITRSLIYLGILVLVVAGLFTYYMLKRPRDANVAWLRWARAIASLGSPLYRLISPGRRDPAGNEEEKGRDLGRALLMLVFVVFVAVLALGADRSADLFPRGLAVPLVLGGWLPFLAYLSALGRAIRAPLILGLAIIVNVLTIPLGDNHSVRRIIAAETAGRPADMSHMNLNQAVKLWMEENGCADGAAECPRPIIVVAAGGASRAGFFTASILGHFLQEATYGHGLDANAVRKRLFAISSVSGGSVGAVMATAALAAKRDSADHPCRQTQFPLWWGIEIGNWRDCFEALASGDFLTPVFIGLTFHDTVRFGPWRDRAAILETAWEDRFERLVTRTDQPRQKGQCFGLVCPFMTLRPTKGHWIPLLVLNGTSEAEGNRIVTTVLDRTYTANPLQDCPSAVRRGTSPGTCALLVQTKYFHDLLADDKKPENWKAKFQRRLQPDFRNKRKVDDVRLSTAAHNSARFPIISPPGGVRNQEHQIIDRIVDGGYVENYGALSALELALAMRAVEPGLAPFVLVISNDPDDALDPEDDVVSIKPQLAPKYQEKRQRQERKQADVDDGEVLTELFTPITTFANTRTARGTHAVAQLRTALFSRMPDCPAHVAHVRVWPQEREKSQRARAVSMSWWLSAPVQRHLHQQTEDSKNENDNGETLKLVWEVLTKTSKCASTAAGSN